MNDIIEMIELYLKSKFLMSFLRSPGVIANPYKMIGRAPSGKSVKLYNSTIVKIIAEHK